MTRKDFMKLVEEAAKGPAVEIDDDGLWMEVMEPLEGLALHRDRVMVGKAGAIQFIRYQALTWSGGWDYRELEDLQFCFRRVDIV